MVSAGFALSGMSGRVTSAGRSVRAIVARRMPGHVVTRFAVTAPVRSAALPSADRSHCSGRWAVRRRGLRTVRSPGRPEVRGQPCGPAVGLIGVTGLRIC